MPRSPMLHPMRQRVVFAAARCQTSGAAQKPCAGAAVLLPHTLFSVAVLLLHVLLRVDEPEHVDAPGV